MSSTGSDVILLQRVRLVDAGRRQARTVVLAGILLAIGSGF
jgi:hypothetical protein